MLRKSKPKSKKDAVPRVKKASTKESAASRDDFVKKKSRPLVPIVDESRWFRQQKRIEKREKQRRKDVAKCADLHLEKATDSLQAVSVTDRSQNKGEIKSSRF